MPDFYSVWTDTGLQKVGAAATAGQPFSMPTAVVGDGGGVPVIPNKGMTALVRQVWSGAVGSITRSKSDPNTCVYEFCIPASDGPFTVREVGLKDAAGALCILGNFPETDKPVAANGSVRDMVIRIPVHFENADSVTLVVDSLTIASNEDVDRKITAHNEHGEAHPDIREALAHHHENNENPHSVTAEQAGAYTKDAVKALFNQGIAKIDFFDCEIPPAGWLEANGAECPASAVRLDELINGRHGRGANGRSLLPDLRGEFVRGWSHGRGVDTGRVLGVFQGDAIRNISGDSGCHFVGGNNASGPFGYSTVSGLAQPGGPLTQYSNIDFSAARVVPTAAENRPRNIAMLVCIYAGI